MRVALLAVGDELLTGEVANTNAIWLTRRLSAAGAVVVSAAAVPDDVAAIADAVAAGLAQAPSLVVTGGLGRTPDDLTRTALALAGKVELRGELPAGAIAIENPAGSALGVRMALAGGVVYALPGVPHEMEAMVEVSVLPDLLAREGTPPALAVVTVRTTGRRESAVAEALAEIERELAVTGDARIAYLAGDGEVAVRITARGSDQRAAAARSSALEARARAALGPAVYGSAADTLAGVVHAALASRRETVAVAESLTGGMLGAALTETPGASLTFRGGLIVYATAAKADLGGVPSPLLEAEGPVSPQVAAALAAGARERLGATYGLGVTGVAGPDPQGGRAPGTVFLALAGAGEAALRELRLPGDRARVRRLACVAALDLLRRALLDGRS